MDINAIIDRAKNVVLKPKETLEAAKAEQPSMQDLIIYVGIVAVPTLIGIIIGYGVVGIGGFWGHFRVPIHLALGWGIAGILYIIPPLAILVFLASLYGLYILYLGIPVFMETPEDKRLIYVIVSIVVYIIIMGIIGWITSAIMWGMIGYPGVHI
jgi:hypothetical protein